LVGLQGPGDFPARTLLTARYELNHGVTNEDPGKRMCESRRGPMGQAAVWTVFVVFIIPSPSEFFWGSERFLLLDSTKLIAETAAAAYRITVLPLSSLPELNRPWNLTERPVMYRFD
jgi:hypothetical protein